MFALNLGPGDGGLATRQTTSMIVHYI